MSPKSRRPDQAAAAAAAEAAPPRPQSAAEAEAAVAAGLPDTGPGALRRVLGSEAGFATIVELVPWAGELGDARGQKPLRMAADLAGNPRITALSVTDNAGGHARLSPDAPGEALRELGHDVIVHVACRDRNRNAMQSLGWDLLVARPDERPRDQRATTRSRATRACPSPCSTSTRSPCSRCSTSWARSPPPRPRPTATPTPSSHCFYLGCAIDPFKRLERDLVPQFLKLALKAPRRAPTTRSPRSATTPTVGRPPALDAPRGHRAAGRRQRLHPRRRRSPGRSTPNKVPGCVVTDELLALVEREAAVARQGPRLLPRARGQAARRRPRSRLAGHLPLRATATRPRSAGSSSSPTPTTRPTGARSCATSSFGLPGAFEPFALDGDGLPDRRAQPGLGPDAHPGAPGPAAAPGRRPLLPLQPRGPRAGVRARARPGFAAWAPGLRDDRAAPPRASRSTCSSRRSRCRSTTAATAATAACPTSPTCAPRATARRTSATAPAAAPATACARSPGTPASGPTPTGGSSPTARSARCSSARSSSRTTTCAAPAPGATRSSGATTTRGGAAPRHGRPSPPRPPHGRPRRHRRPPPPAMPRPAAPEKGPRS